MIRPEGCGSSPTSTRSAACSIRSDHFSLAKAGVPAVSIDAGTDVIGRPPGWGLQQTEDYTAKRYHQPSDEYRPSLDLTRGGADRRHRVPVRAAHRRRRRCRRGAPTRSSAAPRRRSRERARGAAHIEGERGPRARDRPLGARGGDRERDGGRRNLPPPSGVAAEVGAAAPLAYLACTVAMGLIVLCFADAGSRVSMTGGPYAVRRDGVRAVRGVRLGGAALGRHHARHVGRVELLRRFAGRAGSGARLGGAGDRDHPRADRTCAANVRGVGGVTRFNAVATIAKLLPLAARDRRPGDDALVHLAWTTPPSGAAVSPRLRAPRVRVPRCRECARAERRGEDPARTVPRAIFIAMAVVALLYVAIQVVAQGLLGAASRRRHTARVRGERGARSGGTHADPRRLQCLDVRLRERDDARRAAHAVRVRARRLSSSPRRVRSRWHTPYVAIVAQTAIVVVLALFGRLEQLAVAANVGAAGLRGVLPRGGGGPAARRAQRRHPVPRAGGRRGAMARPLVIAGLLWGLRAEEWRAAALVAGRGGSGISRDRPTRQHEPCTA